MSSVTLSMIVKNEEKHLAGCLDSVKDVVDKIVIVDTGSTDSTIEIAKKYNAEVHRFDWVDDFSAARNYALSHSPSDWILYLDADERLEEKSRALLRNIVTRKDKLGVRCKIYNIDEVNNKPKLQSYTRLFKNSEKIKFTGRVHEQIDPSLEANDYKLLFSNILINHLGYNLEKSGLKQKASRNLILLLDEYKENPTGYNAYQIANSYNILGDKDEAFKYFELSLRDVDLPSEYASTSLNNIAQYYYRLGDLNKASSKIDLAFTKDPKNVMTNLIASDIYLNLDEGEKAAEYCIKAYKENEKKDKGRRLIDVLLEPEKIIYNGLFVSFSKNQVNAIDFFFTKLEEHKKSDLPLWEKESTLINLLSTNTPLKEVEISNLVSIINDYNYEFYFALLNTYEQKEIILKIFEELVEKYPLNTTYRNKYVLHLSNAGEKTKAIHCLEEKLEQFPEDPTTIFYMIPLYLETEQFKKLKKIISTGKENFNNNKVFISRINEFEKKINLYLQKYQLD